MNASHLPVVLDVEGLALTDADRTRLAHPLVGGVILFARNWQHREQLCALTRDIKRVRPDVLISVDHEGGRVQRFKTDGFTVLPPMRALGALWMRDALAATDAATACGLVIGSELRACGVDLSFTPVLDLDYGGSSVIGDRAFHSDARVVTLLAKSLAHGLQIAGMAHCGKHFPGHGYVRADSHHEVPVDGRPLDTILRDDALPYAAMRASLTAVMPAHVIYPQVDRQPAGFSRKWLQQVLRRQLGFTGVIFSDDLSMAGARVVGKKNGTVVDAGLAALQAGCDQVLICWAPDKADALLAGLADAQQRGTWQPSAASAQRIERLKPTSEAPRWAELQQDERYRQARRMVQAL
ncbi:MAG: beta-N-acetylhexosaminidase [Betaproteobacteria bacterium]|nr:beta-N-acetylhexosaminidase [Betaproteobacteria bacterium]MDE2047080.1 beta-N-acetylhexosaminidase [Betaproteobacteria bacterium]